MTAGTEEELLEDAARPAPPPYPRQAAHHRRRLPATPATACRFLTEFDQAIPENAGKLGTHVGDSPEKHALKSQHLLRVHWPPSEKALSMMRRTRGRTAQRPRQCNNFDQYRSVQWGHRNGDPWPAPGFPVRCET